MAPRGYVRVVGESHYQDALRDLLQRAAPGRIVEVGVEREPSNQFDPNAIRLFDPAAGRTLGYLPRGTTGFVRLLRDHAIKRHAELTGGTLGKPSIGLVLHLHGEQEDQPQLQPTTQSAAPGLQAVPIAQPPRQAQDSATGAAKSDGGIWSSIRRFLQGRR